MTVEVKFRRVEFPDDPRRCQSVGQNGQCPFEAVEGTSYCPRHGFNSGSGSSQKEELRNYRIAKWQARLNELADNPQVKSLREEIGVLRMVLEEVLNKCNDSDELFLMSNKISDLVVKIEKVVVSCHKLEQSTGQVLDKTAALNFAAQIVEIIGNHITDANTIDLITNEILKSMSGST